MNIRRAVIPVAYHYFKERPGFAAPALVAGHGLKCWCWRLLAGEAVVLWGAIFPQPLVKLLSTMGLECWAWLSLPSHRCITPLGMLGQLLWIIGFHLMCRKKKIAILRRNQLVVFLTVGALLLLWRELLAACNRLFPALAAPSWAWCKVGSLRVKALNSGSLSKRIKEACMCWMNISKAPSNLLTFRGQIYTHLTLYKLCFHHLKIEELCR